MFKNIAKKFFLWVFQSSENPSAVSLTVKGVIVAAIPYVVFLLGIFHISVPSDQVALIGNSLVTVIAAVFTAIGAGMSFYGLIRKVINTYFIPWPAGTILPAGSVEKTPVAPSQAV